MSEQPDRTVNLPWLGGIVSLERRIPGTVARDDRGYVYFADDGSADFGRQFTDLVRFHQPNCATSGGVLEEGCRIRLPAGSVFHAISYKGDLDGWRRQIELGARGLQRELATIEGDRFALSDGRVYPLADCTIELC